MSTLSLQLFKKTERVEALPGGFHHKLTFEARLSAREKLTSHTGEEVHQGFIELTSSAPRFSEPTLVFTPAFAEADTGGTFPASISFYAAVPSNIFGALLNAPTAAKYTLNLSTELMGAIRFNDPMGFEKVWNTEAQNPIAIRCFDFSIEHQAGDA